MVAQLDSSLLMVRADCPLCEDDHRGVAREPCDGPKRDQEAKAKHLWRCRTAQDVATTSVLVHTPRFARRHAHKKNHVRAQPCFLVSSRANHGGVGCVCIPLPRLHSSLLLVNWRVHGTFETFTGVGAQTCHHSPFSFPKLGSSTKSHGCWFHPPNGVEAKPSRYLK